MGQKQKFGWALITLAGVISIGVLSLEIFDLLSSAESETSETLPVVGFEPLPND